MTCFFFPCNLTRIRTACLGLWLVENRSLQASRGTYQHPATGYREWQRLQHTWDQLMFGFAGATSTVSARRAILRFGSVDITEGL